MKFKINLIKTGIRSSPLMWYISKTSTNDAYYAWKTISDTEHILDSRHEDHHCFNSRFKTIIILVSLFVCLFVCLFWVLRPTHIETPLIPTKGSKFWPILFTHDHWAAWVPEPATSSLTWDIRYWPLGSGVVTTCYIRLWSVATGNNMIACQLNNHQSCKQLTIMCSIFVDIIRCNIHQA